MSTGIAKTTTTPVSTPAAKPSLAPKLTAPPPSPAGTKPTCEVPKQDAFKSAKLSTGLFSLASGLVSSAVGAQVAIVAGPAAGKNARATVEAGMVEASAVMNKDVRVFDSCGGLQTDALRVFGQRDGDDWTNADNVRCGANGAVAALALRGKDSVLNGIGALRTQVDSLMSQAPDKETRGDYRDLLKELDRISGAVKQNTATVQDLNRVADVLYQTAMDGNTGANPGDQGVIRMNQIVGLATVSITAPTPIEHSSPTGTMSARMNGPSSKPAAERDVTGLNYSLIGSVQTFRQAQADVTDRLLKQIQNGQSASVHTNITARGNITGNGLNDHDMIVGKSPSGEVFVYDSWNLPHYRTGADAKDYLSKHIGVVAKNGWAGDGFNIVYESLPATSFVKQTGSVL